jgi:hypothetical protein
MERVVALAFAVLASSPAAAEGAANCASPRVHVDGLVRATLQSSCGGEDGGFSYDGDVVSFEPNGFVRLVAPADGGRAFAVTCVSDAAVTATIGGDVPWLSLPDGTHCEDWKNDERACRSGDATLVCRTKIVASSTKAKGAPPSVAVPSWYAGALPATASSPKKLVRIVVQDVAVDIGDLAPTARERLQAIFTSALVSEVRKLNGVSVAGLDEVRALLKNEADRQLAGCDENGCLAEVADALGADAVVTARLAAVGTSHVLALRRLDAATAKARGVDRRFDAGNGEEFLGALGPAVAELFPDHELAPGAVRGVDKELGLRLNPPPIPLWAFVASSSTTAAALALGGACGALSAYFQSSAQAQVDRSKSEPIDAVDVKHEFDAAATSAVAADALFIGGAALALASTGIGFFTDFAGYGDAQ